MDDIVSSWNFNKVIPAHFIAPVRTSPAEFKRAFTFAYEGVEEEEEQQAPAAGPVGFLSALFGGAQRTSAAKVSHVFKTQNALNRKGSALAGPLHSLRTPSGCVLQMTPPVVFPDADISTLRTINNLLLRSGVVKEL